MKMLIAEDDLTSRKVLESALRKWVLRGDFHRLGSG
jgi:hypothetical protein